MNSITYVKPRKDDHSILSTEMIIPKSQTKTRKMSRKEILKIENKSLIEELVKEFADGNLRNAIYLNSILTHRYEIMEKIDCPYLN